jgi:hypothetical protein
VAAALCLSVALPAQAVSASAGPSVAPDTSTVEAYEEAVRLLDPYVVLTEEGTFALTATAAEAGVPQATYDTLAGDMAEINKLLRLEDGSPGVAVAVPGQPESENGILAQENRIIIHWWGIEVWLDSTNSNRLIGVLTGGGGVAALLVAIFGGGPVSAAVVVMVGAIAVGALVYCNASGRGVKIIKPIPLPLPYCTSQ